MPFNYKRINVDLMEVDDDKFQGLVDYLNQNMFNFSVKSSTTQTSESNDRNVSKYQVFNSQTESNAPLLSDVTMAQLEAMGNQLLSNNLTPTIPTISPNFNTPIGVFGTPGVQREAAMNIKMEELDTEALNSLEGHPDIVKPTPLLPGEYSFNPQSMNSTSVSGIPLFQLRNTNSHLGTMNSSSTKPTVLPMKHFKQIKLEVADETYQFGKPLSSQKYNSFLFRNFPINFAQNGNSGIPQNWSSNFGISNQNGYVQSNFGGQQLQFSHMQWCPAQANSFSANTTVTSGLYCQKCLQIHFSEKRHSWRKDERKELNAVYKVTRNPSDEKIVELATKFAVDDFRVRSFFQRKRELKIQ
ncbi:hypothetical protein CAEBREN_02228 [Caenorhabditis brenneri]|uniref:Homeobox domain-containing protein n=1 Tax=Caenorhabditis brenneri TaxID=135651 RepID=G0N4G0_CAEBE|nr:hypothetical protein CAEBREN_02228 [Caenorhabditis brenneri]